MLREIDWLSMGMWFVLLRVSNAAVCTELIMWREREGEGGEGEGEGEGGELYP